MTFRSSHPLIRSASRRRCFIPTLLLLAALLPTLYAQETPAGQPDNPPPNSFTVPPSRSGAPVPGGRGGARGGAPMGRAPQPPVAPGEGPTCALDATIYDVRLPADQIGRLDIEALSRASTSAASFEKALADLGTTQPLYRANQSIRLAGESITVGTTAPYITSSQVSNTGQAMNTVSYTQTGAVIHIAGRPGARDSVELDLSIELATMTEGTTAITPTVKATVMRRATLAHKGPIEPLKPFVVLTIDAASPDATGKAVAYIARVTLAAPELPPRPANRGE